MKRQGAEGADDASTPEIDQIPVGKLFCNRFKYDIDAYLAQRRQPEPTVKSLDAIMASQKFHPSIEIRMRDAQAQPPPDGSTTCKDATEKRPASGAGRVEGDGRTQDGRSRLPVMEQSAAADR
jgi:hypothetical protein